MLSFCSHKNNRLRTHESGCWAGRLQSTAGRMVGGEGRAGWEPACPAASGPLLHGTLRASLGRGQWKEGPSCPGICRGPSSKGRKCSCHSAKCWQAKRIHGGVKLESAASHKPPVSWALGAGYSWGQSPEKDRLPFLHIPPAGPASSPFLLLPVTDQHPCNKGKAGCG